MAEYHLLDKKVKLLWLAPYIALFLFIYLIFALLYSIAYLTQNAPFFQESPLLLVLFFFFIFFSVLILLPSYLFVDKKYKTTGFSLGDDTLNIKTGGLSKENILLSYNRIKNVSPQSTLLERLLQLQTLHIEIETDEKVKKVYKLPGIPHHVELAAELLAKARPKSTTEEKDKFELILQELKEIKKLLKTQEKPAATFESLHNKTEGNKSIDAQILSYLHELKKEKKKRRR